MGRVVLVTGGVRGVGAGISKVFADQGATVVTCARRPVEGLPYDFHSCDIRDDESVKALIEAIVADLRTAELVKSTRGARGGYSLAREPRDISLGEVFRAVDGPLAEVRGLRPHETAYEGVATHLPTVWVALRASLRSVLDETSLADVLSGELPDRVATLAADPDAWRSR